jgi:hypothetical protein
MTMQFYKQYFLNNLKIVTFSFLIFILYSCDKNKLESPILGNWNLIHIYKNGDDILGNNKDKEFYYFRSLYIEKLKINQITIELGRDSNLYADFKINYDTITLTRSTKSEFNGKYKIEVKDTTSIFFKSKIKLLKLSHFNQDIQIYGAVPLSENKL